MSVGGAAQAERPVTREAGAAGKRCWLVRTHKATRTDVLGMEIDSKKGEWISGVRVQTQSRGFRYPQGKEQG